MLLETINFINLAKCQKGEFFMKDNIRLEDFPKVKKIYHYHCAYNSEGKVAIFNDKKDLLFYEDFSMPGEPNIYNNINIMWDYFFETYNILPIIWSNYTIKICGLYSLTEHSYIVPLGNYSYFYAINNDVFLIGDGISFYFITIKNHQLSVHKLLLDVNSKIIQAYSQMIIFKQQTENCKENNCKSEYTAAYSLQEEKFFLSFDLELDMIKPYSFGMIVTKNDQMGIYSYNGDILMPLSNNSIDTFWFPSNCIESEPKVGLVKKSTIKNGHKFTGAYTYNNQCIVPIKFKNIYPFYDGLILAENYNLSYTIYSIEKRKSIIPPCLGVLHGKSKNTIKAVKFIRFVGKESDFESECVRGYNCGDYTEKREIFKKAVYNYIMCYDLYSYDGKLIESDILDTYSSNHIWNSCDILI